MGPQRQMEMIGHETVREDAHRQASAGVGQEGDERVKVAIGMKHWGTAIAAIDDVIAIAQTEARAVLGMARDYSLMCGCRTLCFYAEEGEWSRRTTQWTRRNGSIKARRT